jgi:hypothetical protein
VQPTFNGPVYRLRDYWSLGATARPDEKGTRWLADQSKGPIDVKYDKAGKMIPASPAAAPAPAGAKAGYQNALQPEPADPYRNRLR